MYMAATADFKNGRFNFMHEETCELPTYVTLEVTLEAGAKIMVNTNDRSYGQRV